MMKTDPGKQRTNIALSPENLDYVKRLATVTGRNHADVIDAILTKYRKENPEVLEQAEAFLATMQEKLPGL